MNAPMPHQPGRRATQGTRSGYGAALIVSWLTPVTALAGGPLVFDVEGAPVGWPVATPVPYHNDAGGLGLLTQEEAAAMVTRLLARWENVSTARIAFEARGEIAVDVNVNNFGMYLGPLAGRTAPLGQNVMVFDADGAIFDLLFGVGTGVAGFAGLTFFSDGETVWQIGEPIAPGSHIVEALVFLNGKLIDGVDDPWNSNPEVPLSVYEAVFVHEFGHFCGLDHTQIHGLKDEPKSDSPDPTEPVETMFPFLLHAGQATLERDDSVALSALYPTPAFFSSTGRITGKTRTSDGRPFSGVNVIARNLTDDSDAVSYVSGADGVHEGEFNLAGLIPGASYRVEIQEIDALHFDGSSVGPFRHPVTLPGPPEFYNGAGESADPDTDDPAARTPVVALAGESVGGIDVVFNRQPFLVLNDAFEGRALTSVAVGDFDGSGILDFVATQLGAGNLTRFYRGIGEARFLAPRTVEAFPANFYVVAGQFNPSEDGFLDIAVGSLPAEVRVYLGDGGGQFGTPTAIVSEPGSFPDVMLTGLGQGDLNGDAFADVFALVASLVQTGNVGTLGSAKALAMLGDGSGGFEVVTTELPAGSGFPRSFFDSIEVAHFAGGPEADVIGFSGDKTLSLLVNDGTGRFQVMPFPLNALTSRTNPRLGVGDLDGNGSNDLVISNLHPVDGPHNFTRSFVDILLGDGAGGFVLSERYEVPESFQCAFVVEDFDGDGKLDIASTGAATGVPGAKVSIAFGDGTGKVRDISTIWGLSEYPGRAMTGGDFDGDGRIDLLVNNDFGLGPGSILLNRIAGPSTPVRSIGLHARSSPRGVELTWTLDEEWAPRLTGVHVQRAPAFSGPYANRSRTVLEPHNTMRFVDSEVQSGATYWYRVVLLRKATASEQSHPVRFTVPGQTPASPTLHVAAATSGRDAIQIRYRVEPGAALVRLGIYDVRGRRIDQLFHGVRASGAYTHAWQRRDHRGGRVARGIYLVRLVVGPHLLSERIVLAR